MVLEATVVMYLCIHRDDCWSAFIDWIIPNGWGMEIIFPLGLMLSKMLRIWFAILKDSRMWKIPWQSWPWAAHRIFFLVARVILSLLSDIDRPKVLLTLTSEQTKLQHALASARLEGHDKCSFASGLQVAQVSQVIVLCKLVHFGSWFSRIDRTATSDRGSWCLLAHLWVSPRTIKCLSCQVLENYWKKTASLWIS